MEGQSAEEGAAAVRGPARTQPWVRRAARRGWAAGETPPTSRSEPPQGPGERAGGGRRSTVPTPGVDLELSRDAPPPPSPY